MRARVYIVNGSEFLWHYPNRACILLALLELEIQNRIMMKGIGIIIQGVQFEFDYPTVTPIPKNEHGGVLQNVYAFKWVS
jgi:hypothetical protein